MTNSHAVIKTSASLAALIGLAACGFPKTGPAPAPLSPVAVAAAQKKNPNATEASLSQGREAFVQKCNGCHGYPDLQATSEQAWPDIMKRMGKKSELDSAKTEAVLQFILAARGEGAAAPATEPAPQPAK